MTNREHTWTVFFAVLFTLLIWLWAEGENRESGSATFLATFAATSGNGEFRVRAGDPDDPSVFLQEIEIQMVVEGPSLALRRAAGRTQRLVIPIDDPVHGAVREIDLLDAVQDLPELADEGIIVTSVDPRRFTLRIDQIEIRRVPVSAAVPGMTGLTIEEVSIEPAEVEIAMSRSDWEWALEQFGRNLVYLDLDPEELRALEPGATLRRENVRVLLQPQVAQEQLVQFDPPPVSVALRVQRQLVEVADWPVPVKVSMPIRDEPNYDVIIDTEYELIPGVTLEGDAETIRKLRNNEIRVRAIIDLTSDELEQGITEKAVEWMLPPGLRVISTNGSGSDRPVIPFRIIKHQDAEDEPEG